MSASRFKKLLFVFLLLGNTLALFGQSEPEAAKDTTRRRTESISPGDIPMKAMELKIRTNEAILELITDEAILRLKEKNRKTLAAIDAGLIKYVGASEAAKNIRYLENRRIELIQEKRKIDLLQEEFVDVIGYLDAFKQKLTREARIWKNTKRKVERDSLITVVPVKIDETLFYIDSTLVLISQKSNAVMEILERTIEKGVEIDAEIESTKALIVSRQNQAFQGDHLPFFRLDLVTDYGKELADSFTQLNLVDLVELKEYISSQGSSVVLTVLLFFTLLYLFVIIKRKVRFQESGYGYFYKNMLFRVLSHQISATIVLTLFCTLFIFPDRPVIFREISYYVIAFPLIHILSALLDKKYHLYLYAFGVLVVFYMLVLLISSESVSYRILLLFISAAEITLLALFLMRFETKHELGKTQRRIIYSFVILHLALACVGLISNIAGRVILTEIVLGAVFYNIFYGLVFFITAMLFNGLVATGIDTSRGQRVNVFRLYGEKIKKNNIYLLNFLAIILWIFLMLKNFRIDEYVYNGFVSVITNKISIGFASFSLDSILIFFLVIYVSILISNMLRMLLEEDVLNRFSLSKGLPHTIAMLIKYSLITAGFFLAVNAAGIPLDKLTIILGAMSVGIGFGLQNIFNNLVSGLILLFERPIQLGDTVEVGQLTGNVKSIGLRSSNVITFQGAEVIVPNGQLISNEVINWTLSDQKRRIELAVGVSYDSDPKLVHRLLMDILNAHEELVKDPEPLVFFTALGESSLDFALLFWVADYNHGRRIKSEILFSIFEVFKENNIEIPFPQRDIHVRSVDKDIVLRKEEGAL